MLNHTYDWKTEKGPENFIKNWMKSIPDIRIIN